MFEKREPSKKTHSFQGIFLLLLAITTKESRLFHPLWKLKSLRTIVKNRSSSIFQDVKGHRIVYNEDEREGISFCGKLHNFLSYRNSSGSTIFFFVFLFLFLVFFILFFSRKSLSQSYIYAGEEV